MKFLVAGIDEAGRGPLAGPVTAACVVFPEDYRNKDINDSKKLSEANREELFPEIVNSALAYAVVCVGPRRIEALNIREATRLAMTLSALRVLGQLEKQNLAEKIAFQIDGDIPLSIKCRQETIIKGDAKVMTIGAASIIAKVTRDRIMHRIETFYPGYDFAQHKGYGTTRHRQQISEKGPCPVHRRTFGGVREFLFPEEKKVQVSLL